MSTTAKRTKSSPRAEAVEATSADNYRYWQEEGASWPAEYDRRKTYQPDVHIQEAMLAHYMTESAPAKVLEYGCGFGRHLSYLRDVPGIDIHGYDQSPTMLGELGKRFEPKWVKDHVTFGTPVGVLPYGDGAFDIAYTAEVLVHVRPEDVRTRLRELMRVAKWHVLHIEPSAEVAIASDDHLGCWKHDLVSIYRELGFECEVLPSLYSSHDVYRVVLENDRKLFAWSPVVARLFHRANTDLRRGLAERDHALSTLLDAVKSVLPGAPELDAGHVAQVAGRIRDLSGELAYLKKQQSYRLAKQARGTRAYSVARWAKNRNAAIVRVRATGEHHQQSQGTEVWLFGARESPTGSAIPWDYFEVVDGDWQRAANVAASHGEYLKAKAPGAVQVPVGGASPQLMLLKHPAGGICEVSWRSHTATFDLFSREPVLTTVTCHEGGIVIETS